MKAAKNIQMIEPLQDAKLGADATPAEKAGIKVKGDLYIRRRNDEEEETEAIA